MASCQPSRRRRNLSTILFFFVLSTISQITKKKWKFQETGGVEPVSLNKLEFHVLQESASMHHFVLHNISNGITGILADKLLSILLY